MPAVVTAACALIIVDGLILAVRGPRGLDVPGGHLEPSETPLEALTREVEEEAGARVTGARAIAVLESDFDIGRPSYLVIYRAEVELGPFQPRHETTTRVLLEPGEFLRSYTGGNPELMAQLVALIGPDGETPLEYPADGQL
jgi:8-oxo-dGTP diphosphatase